MPTDAKQLTADEVLERLNAIHEFSETHPEEWRNQVARDLNELMRHSIWLVDSDDGAITYLDFGNAALRIVERVAKFEEIEAKGKPL